MSLAYEEFMDEFERSQEKLESVTIPVSYNGQFFAPPRVATVTITGLLSVLRTHESSRELSLAITKLEEARMWLKEIGG